MPRLMVKSKPKILGFDELKKDEIICTYSECGRSFDKPIELTISGPSRKSEKYEACPYCFQKVASQLKVLAEKKNRKIRSPPVITTIDKEEKNQEKGKPTGCPYSFGHLSRRSKGASIPEDCLICREITQCMLQQKA